MKFLWNFILLIIKEGHFPCSPFQMLLVGSEPVRGGCNWHRIEVLRQENNWENGGFSKKRHPALNKEINQMRKKLNWMHISTIHQRWAKIGMHLISRATLSLTRFSWQCVLSCPFPPSFSVNPMVSTAPTHTYIHVEKGHARMVPHDSPLMFTWAHVIIWYRTYYRSTYIGKLKRTRCPICYTNNTSVFTDNWKNLCSARGAHAV